MNQHRSDAKALDGQKIRFILSAGRTGTVFLSRTLADLYPQYEVVHEPPSSRRTFMLWNAEAAGIAPAGSARRIFKRNRQRVLTGNGDRLRIEINPFLHPLAPELHEIVSPLYVVHLVRDAMDWIRSMANFGAAGWRRHLIDYTPLARTIHPAARKGWSRLDTFSRFAWRWRLANEQLLSLAKHSDYYGMIRYEDLFSSDESAACATLQRLVSGLQIEEIGTMADISWDRRVNPGRCGKIGDRRDWPPEVSDRVMEICGPLMKEFGYVG